MAWLGRREYEEARRRIVPLVHRTPLLSFRTLGDATGTRAFLKCENLQKTGSFKVRGALNAVAALAPEERARGVVTVSAGNHAQAVAWAAGKAGVRAVVVMPQAAAPIKVEAAQGYGAEVILHGTAADAFRKADRLARDEGLVFLHPFDAEEVIAGHGSTGLELAEEVPGPAVVVVPVGGGGQIAGIAGALAACRPATEDGGLGAGDGGLGMGDGGLGTGDSGPGTGDSGPGTGDSGPGAEDGGVGTGDGTSGHRVVGVEPEGAPAMRRSLDAGRAVRLDAVDTVADGLAAPMAGELTFRYVREFVEDVTLVSDDEIASAMRLLATRAKVVAEPSGAAAVAAVMHGRVAVEPGDVVVALVSGGNVEPEVLAWALREGAPWP